MNYCKLVRRRLWGPLAPVWLGGSDGMTLVEECNVHWSWARKGRQTAPLAAFTQRGVYMTAIVPFSSWIAISAN